MDEQGFAILLAEFRKMVQVSEGSIEYLYLDTKGNPTIGLGYLVSNLTAALELPFYIKKTPEVVATPEQITTEFNDIKKAKYGQKYSAKYYRALTSLFLQSEKIESLFKDHVRTIVASIENHFNQFADYPLPAQLGVLDMVYNMGITGFLKKFPEMAKAIKKSNWQIASTECQRSDISDVRNDEVKKLFEQAEAIKLAKTPKKNSTNSSTQDETAILNNEEKSLRSALNYEHVTLFNATTGTSNPQPGSWEAIKFQSTSSTTARK